MKKEYDSTMKTSILRAASGNRWPEIQAAGRHETIEAGMTIIRQGNPCDLFYIEFGTMGIFVLGEDGNSEEIDSVGAGDDVGEISFLHQGTATASVIAKDECRVVRWCRDDLHNLLNRDELVEAGDVFHKKTVRRLEHSNAKAKGHINRLRTQQQRLSFIANAFVVFVFYITAYMIILATTNKFAQEEVSIVISAVLLTIFSVLTFTGLRSSGVPMRTFGFQFDSWRNDMAMVVGSSLLFIVMLTVLKAFIIWSFPGYEDESLFLLGTIIEGENVPIEGLTWAKYILHLTLFLLLVPFQEIIFRSSLQGSLALIMQGSEVSIQWRSILLSNLIFLSAHMHRNLTLAVLVFVPGILFGWIFHRCRSVVASSVSHMIVGGYGIFVLGFLHMI